MTKQRKAGFPAHFRLLTVVLIVLGIALFVAGHLVKYGALNPRAFLVDFYDHSFAELLSIVITVYLIDRLNRLREQRQADQREQEELILRMGDGDLGAVKLLRQRGWLQDGTLRGARLDNGYLTRMELQGADLREADLRNASLAYADLRGANLRGATLQGARLHIAKYNKATRWPEDVDPVARGAILIESDDAPWL
jgi:hypothetical protein